jgi:hypothetical protein
MKSSLAVAALAVSMTSLQAAEPPSAKIANGNIQATIYLPDSERGFYRGTRFDWSGVLSSLHFGGHNYYGAWFTKTDPSVHDFVYAGNDIVAGPCSAITGPVDEFAPVGWEQAKPGNTFVKIGVGALVRPDGAAYDNYRLYKIADPGKWNIDRGGSSVEFVQTLNDRSSGYGYRYQKTVVLTPGKPEMVLRHSIRNTGSHSIETTVYNHNFLVLDGRPTEAGTTITTPFEIKSSQPPEAGLAEIRGRQIFYVARLKDHDTVATPIQGFSGTGDNRFRIEDKALNAGIAVKGDRPLLKESLWSIRSVIAMEPFITVSVKPGQEFTWTATYEYYKLPRKP